MQTMIESPDVLVVKGHMQEKMPSIGQVVSKVSDLVTQNDAYSQKRPTNLHSFISDSSYLCKELKNNQHVDQENKEPVISHRDLPPSYDEVADPESIVQQIAAKIERELKEAKRTSLECGEVLVPCNLTHQIAQDVVTMSESEPCGLRGGVLFVNLEESDNRELRRVGCIKIGDRNIVPTFEMYLNLKRSNSGWLNQVSNRLFRNFNRNSIVISENYQLSKKKLYRSDCISMY